LGKALSLNPDGTLDKIPLANAVCAEAAVKVARAGALAELLDGCEMNQALALGTCSRDRARVVIAERQAQSRARSPKDHFQFAQDRGWALLDVDVKDAPPEITAKLIRLGGVWPVLTTCIRR
jgi:hypothetical protein